MVVVSLIWGSNPKGLLACPCGGARASHRAGVSPSGLLIPYVLSLTGVLTQQLWVWNDLQLMLPLKVKIIKKFFIMEHNMNWMYSFLFKLKVIWISIVAFCYLDSRLDIMSPLMVSCKNTLGLIFYDNAITEIAYPDLYTEWLCQVTFTFIYFW